MPLSHSVLRRYTPPTCTLEIRAKSSPLSRWVGQSVLKDLRFELRFDDPRKPEDKRVTIRGDRTDLEILYEAVNSYVQDLLDPSPTQLSLALRTPATAAGSTPDENHNSDSNAHPVPDVNPSAPVAGQTSEEELNKSDDSSLVLSPESSPKLRTLKPRTLPTEIYLQPRGLTAHDLFLGRLATEESGPVVDLSVLQLFDLATALDEYAAEVVALPNLNNPLSWKKGVPAWTPTAAAVLLAVGVTAAGVKFLNPRYATQEAAAPKGGQQSSQTGQTQIASGVPTAPTSPLQISPLPTPVLPPPLASSPTLPPPSPVIVPPPPTLSNAPLSQRPSLTLDPSPIKTDILPKAAAPAPVPGSATSSTNPTLTSKGGSPSSAKEAPTQSKTPRDLTTPPPLPTNFPSLNPTPSPPPNLIDPAVPPPGSVTRSATPSAESAPADNAADSKLSDTIPQVAEARNYLQERWKPPAGLKQTLEYSLTLDTDGSIQRILPLGQAAGEYMDSTGIPRPGDRFVSPVAGGGNPTIRLVLTADGKVQTFLEQR